MKLTFDPETHAYTLDGVRVPSVTDICSMLNPYAEAPVLTLQQAARRGTLVHEYCELLDYGTPLDAMEVEPELQGYVIAYSHFLRDYSPEWQYIEKPIANEKDGYAGTLDRFGIIDKHPTLVDIKTASNVTKPLKISWACQLAGYDRALNTIGTSAAVHYDLVLKSDGTYRLIDSLDTELKYGFHASDIFGYLLKLKKLIGVKN